MEMYKGVHLSKEQNKDCYLTFNLLHQCKSPLNE